MTDPTVDALSAALTKTFGSGETAYKLVVSTAPDILAALAAKGYVVVRAEVALNAADRTFLHWCHERFQIVFRESPNLGWMQRLARLATKETRPRHDPTDHDCKGGVSGDRYPF